MTDIVKQAASIVPSERQIRWQELEFYGFVHFGMNTFTDQEWGFGDADPALFNPTELDADQWVDAFKAAGMKGLILTCKHHDGFCLWPSEYTDYSVKHSPWRDGRGDVVREVADACRRGGIKFGIYLSPWDRHEPSYGDSDRYNQFFLNQLRELLTNYGEIFCVWFDGACGEGPNGKRQVYDWDAYYALIRELQPNAVISVCGPDVRWCGNEAGYCRPSEWSVVPAALQDVEKIQEASQKVDDGQFSRQFSSQDDDLGSREAIKGVTDLVWYPAEVNTSIRPGWFYHASQDDEVRSLEELLDIYYNSVGGNAAFLLNVPPDKRGLIHENDVQRLTELGDTLRETFRTDLAAHGIVTASNSEEGYEPQNIIRQERTKYWRAQLGHEQAVLEIDLGKTHVFDRIVLGEWIRQGQRIESFALSYHNGDEWEKFFKGTIVGYKRICRFPQMKARKLRLEITQSRIYPTLGQFEVYLSSKRERKNER